MELVTLTPRSSAPLSALLGDEDRRHHDEVLERLRRLVDGRRMWHVSSAAVGGGVAEMLGSLLPYALGAGIDVRWAVIDAKPEFFEVTKRIHNHLHENVGDGGPLAEQEREIYVRGLAMELADLCKAIEPGDVVVLHDPQTAGLVRPLRDHGAVVIWRCHVGVDRPGPEARLAWDFLRADVEAADAAVFSRPDYAWEGLPADRVAIIPPVIDVASAKNQLLDVGTRDAILAAAGVVPVGPSAAGGVDGSDGTAPPRYLGADGEVHEVHRRADAVQERPVPADAPLVVQVSRWDRLKDPVGVLQGFALDGPPDGAHLVLAGPAVGEVADDPESAEVFAEVRAAWEGLPDGPRERSHLLCLPMVDADENAAIVNALQRRADVVVQKSLAEGFGLTVAEAMWKRRPVVASRVGGIQDQVVDGESGVLIDPPTDLVAFGAVVADLLVDDERARKLGEAAHDRVRQRFLPVHHYEAEADLVARLLAP
jgi:trehalose synthase